jgi:hypothetical protein
MWQHWMQKLENLFAAVAFAEEGEFDMARQFADQGSASNGQQSTGKGRQVKPVRGREAPVH